MQFPNVQNYFQLCTMIGLKQLIVTPTWVTYKWSLIIISSFLYFHLPLFFSLLAIALDNDRR